VWDLMDQPVNQEYVGYPGFTSDLPNAAATRTALRGAAKGTTLNLKFIGKIESQAGCCS